MGFLSRNKVIARRLRDTFTYAVGALPATQFTLIDIGSGLPQSPRDIDSTGIELREPVGAIVAPHTYLHNHEIIFTRGFRISMSAKATTGAGGGAFITLFRPDAPITAHRLVGRVGIDNDGDLFQLIWRGVTTNTSFTVANDTWYRVGFEILDNRVRAYLNPTVSITDDTAEMDLEPRIETAVDNNGNDRDYDTTTIFPGIGLSGSGVGAAFSGADTILIEEWDTVSFRADFPAGSSFAGPTHNPYTRYKTEKYLWAMFNNARLV